MSNFTLHDRYDIIRPIARGGMAMVSLAREVDTAREVALKLLTPPEGARVDEWKLRFQHEFHTAARLRHPHLVATYDYAVAKDGTPFFTMEYCPGPGLDEHIPLPVEKVQAYLPGLLKALGYIHHHGLVHADLKPENIRLGADGEIRLMDFGLVTRTGQASAGIQGTLPYMPPEVIRRAPVDRRSDLYALGAVVYHLLAGEPPFSGEGRAVLMGHLEQAPQPLRQRRPDVPEQLEALVMRLLAKEPLQRFQSAAEALLFLGEGSALEDDQTLFHPPLVGRQNELKELMGAYGRVGEGAYEEVWLSGDADVGLEALLEEFCCRAQLSGATVLRGEFRLRMAPLEGLRSVGRGLVAMARHHAEVLPTLTPVLARLLPELGEAQAQEGADPQQERLRLFDALIQLVRLATRSGPLVFAFSSAHLADQGWREWLEYTRRNAAQLPILVVNTCVGQADLDFDPSRTEIEVPPLDAIESHEACRAILGAAELDATFTAGVFALTAGHPARIEAVLRQLVEAGKLRRQGGQWQLPTEPLEAVVASIDPAWAKEQRFRSLPPLAVSMVETLALLGRETDLSLLWAVVRTPRGSGRLSLESAQQQDGADLFEALRHLEEAGWVQAGQGRCRLSPEADRDGILARMSEMRRWQTHGAIAIALERALAEAPGDTALLGELASHAIAAGDRHRGPRYALAAAQQHTRLFALEDAETLLREALLLLEGTPEAEPALLVAIQRLRADVARWAGDRRLAEAAYQRAIALAGELNDAEALAALENGFGRLKVVTGEMDEAQRLFRSVLARLGAQTVHPEVAQALTQLGRWALLRGDLPDARRWVEQALALARQGGYRALVRDNMAQLGYLYVASGDDRAAEGLALLFDALTLTEKDEAKLELNAVYTLLGNAQLLLGRFTEAKLAFQRNCDLCEEIGAAPHDEAMALMRRAHVELELGDFRGARKTARPAGALARMVGNRQVLAEVRLIEGMAALYQGDFTIYQDAANWVEDSLKSDESTYMQTLWHVHRSEAEAFLGQWSAALSSANAALEVLGAEGGREQQERALLVKSQALRHMGLSRPARQVLDEMPAPRNEAHQARWLLAKSQFERADGKRTESLQLAERALELARRSGVVPVAASCCLAIARVSQDREEALAWTRKALLDAETCEHPALEAEALFQASTFAKSRDQAEWFLNAAEDAWRRATAGLTSSIVDAFAATEERRPLRDFVKKRLAEGYRPTTEDHAALLALLGAPPDPRTFLPKVTAFCREGTRAHRVGLFWEDESGVPVQAYGDGAPFGGAANPMAELEAAREAGEGAVMVPLAAAPDAGEPWGAILVVPVSPEQADRLEKLLAHLGGALWAARRLWLAERASAPSAVPEGWPTAERRIPALSEEFISTQVED